MTVIKYDTKHWIYVIGPMEMMDRVKIGRANNVARRMAALQCGSPLHLHLWGSFPAGWQFDQAIYMEKAIHKRIADRRVKGEWFQISPKEAIDLVAQYSVLHPGQINEILRGKRHAP